MTRWLRRLQVGNPNYSPDGRLCLIKSVLMAIPVHFLSVLQLPRWAIKEMERRCRVFLWKGQEEINGGHCLVAWKDLCRPISNGGLGIKDIDLFGKALRMKWDFKRLEHKDRPWTMAGWGTDRDLQDIISSTAVHMLGDGCDTNFWRGNWLPGDGSIASRWPILFSFVGRANLTVSQGLSNNTWVRRLQGSLSGRALLDYLALWDELQLVQLQQGVEDFILWKFSTNGQFSVASAYEFFFLTVVRCPYGEMIWKARAPARVRFFMWLMVKGHCLTADNLAKRRWPHDPACPLCLTELEDCDHLLSKCSFTIRVWSLLRS